MTATKYPVGLPVKNPTKSYWQTPPLPIKDHRTTPELPPCSQYAIVGSGVTGAFIAHKLLLQEPSAQITMLEARTAASGASGRNGGHCRGGRFLAFKEYLARFGKDEALMMDKWESDNVRNVRSFIKQHEIACDWRDVESVEITTSEEQLAEFLDNVRVLHETAEKEGKTVTGHKIFSREEAQRDLLVPAAVGAVGIQAGVLNPYKLVCRVLEMSLDKGLNLQTNTPVHAVTQHGTRWLVETERGDIVVETVILATNAYTPALYPALAEFIIPTRAQIAAIQSGSHIAGNPALKRTAQINDRDYFQCRQKPFTGAGDIIIGGGRGQSPTKEQPLLDDSTIHPLISHYQTKEVPIKYFGKENWGEDGEVVMEWTGIMGYTRDGQPVIGQAPGQDGLWVCAGFHGHGMAMTFQAAEALVGLLAGRDEEVARWMPKNFGIERVPGLRR